MNSLCQGRFTVLRAVNGQTEPLRGLIALDIDLSTTKVTFSMYVCDKSTVPFLLGADFLSRVSGVMDYGAMVFRTGNGTEVPLHVNRNCTSSVYFAALVAYCVSPPHSKSILDVEVNSGYDDSPLVFEPD